MAMLHQNFETAAEDPFLTQSAWNRALVWSTLARSRGWVSS